MRKKGYTLIEILGIIVVLAVIAVITIPLISGIIVKAKKASYKDSIYGIIESARIYLASNIDSIGEKEIEFVCDGEVCKRENGDRLNFKGSTPKSGSIYIKGNEILIESVYNGKYYANNDTGEVVITEEDSALTRGELTELINQMKKEMDILKGDNEKLKSKDTQLQSEIMSIKSGIVSINEIYPIGSIYITTSNVNPSSLFKNTTWERYGVGRTLLGTDSSSGKTGGSNTLALTVNELPAHSHTVVPTGSVSLVNTTHTHNIPQLTGATTNAGIHSHYVGTSSSGVLNTGSVNNGGDGAWFTITYNGSRTQYPVSAFEAGEHAHQILTNISITENNNTVPTANFIGTTSTTSSIGSGNPLNIQNPYITVYMWKRIS